MTSQVVQSKGIFHGLPTFPDQENKTYTAIVTGANGISGAHILRTLMNAPNRWEKIYALSRKPPNFELSDKVTFISVDFLQTPENIAQILQEHKVSA
jgi:nucleoside-diphosphate-sugar epimerase